MSDYRQWDLIYRLLKKTQKEQLDWDAYGDERDQVITGLANYAVVLKHPQPGLYRVEIIDESANLIDSFFDTQVENPPAKKKASVLVQELYERARRQALGADVALDNILKALDDDE